MTDYNELADRIERAEGPDRALDAEIALATGRFFLAEPRYPGAERMYGYIDEDGRRVEPGNGGQYSLIPAYTASIDAAKQLVPVGWAWGLYSDGSCAMGRTPAPGCILDVECDADGATPSLALCAAALRARSAS